MAPCEREAACGNLKNMQQVHLRINDAATGQATPVRLRITDASGTYYAPHGRLTEFATGVNQDVGGNVLIGAKKWCYIDGTCEILLPPGELHVEISKGPEYKPIDEAVTLIPGKMSLRFTIERWCDMRKLGWYSGDTRVHYMTPDAALLEGQAEDLAVVNLLAKETFLHDRAEHKAVPNLLSFSGQAFARETSNCGVAVNTLNESPQLGSLGLLHCHRVVYPLTFDDANWTLADWCGQCHRKKGLVVWTAPNFRWVGHGVGETLANAVLGDIDAFELTSFEDSKLDSLVDYYALLDVGVFLPLVGASAKESNETLLGGMRTYAFVQSDQAPTYSAWIESIRSGKTFVTNGPLLQWTLDGKPAIGPLRPASGQVLRVHAEATSLASYDKIQIMWNGEPIASSASHSVDCEFAPQESGWIAARCLGGERAGWTTSGDVFAHTSALEVRLDDRPFLGRESAVRRLRADIDKLSKWANRESLARLISVLEEARTVLAKKLS